VLRRGPAAAFAPLGASTLATTAAPRPRKILIIQTAFIGDIVFASPLVYAIKNKYDQVEVALLVRPRGREVAECIPGVDKVITFDKHGRQKGWKGLLSVRRAVRRENFDLLLSPHRSLRSALLSALSGVSRRVGYRSSLGKLAYNIVIRPDDTEPCHLKQDLRLLERAGIPEAGTRLRLEPPPGQQEYVTGFLRKHGLVAADRLVALCIGAHWASKRWPAVYFASLAGALIDRGYVPVLFGGKDEAEVAMEIAQDRGEALVSCLGNRLSESAALLARCQMAVGGDSGLTHMARALGLPTVMIFGPTDPRAHCFEESTVVLNAQVKCRPCSSHGPRRCPQKHHDCMRLVSPEDVLDALRRISSLQTPSPLSASPRLNSRPAMTSAGG